MPLTRVPRRRALIRLATVCAATGALVALGGSASAHVSVSSADAAPGGYGKMTFRVPNESDTASTVSLRIQIPEDAAMASLRVQPMPGWTASMTMADLAEPLEAHGQRISSYVSVVEFRAADGAGIGPGQFQEFSLSGGPFPEAESLAFPAVQGYSDGSESAWIEPTVAGEEEPERPAPVLALAGGPAADAGPTPGASTAETAEDAGHESRSADAGTLALVVAFFALGAAIAGVVLGVRANRRTVSS